jgi:hypothetical protein
MRMVISLPSEIFNYLRASPFTHKKDLTEGWGRVQMPYALDRKYPNASADWRWQWVFPQESRWRNRETGEQGRHHVHESIVQKAVKEAVAKAGLVKHVSCHTCGTVLLLICSRMVMTFERSRSCWGIRM